MENLLTISEQGVNMLTCRNQRISSIIICPARPPRDLASLHSLRSAQAVAGIIKVMSMNTVVPVVRWSGRFAACVVCKTTESKHASRGRCNRCLCRELHPIGDYTNHARNRRYKVDDFIFDKWNEVAAYLLGVLYTDGHIAKQSLNRHSVDICLAKKDEEWLMQLRAAFKCKA